MNRLGPEDLALHGRFCALVPLSPDHTEALARAVGDLHRLWYTTIPDAAGMDDEIARRIRLRSEGCMLPFAVLDADGRPVGMTTYMNIDHSLPRVEIGSTWIGVAAQRGPLNTEAKRMLLGHAFDVWGCEAVEFRTHRLNLQSRRAIERLGAQFDGVLRAHMRMADGSIRDTACYSVIKGEWPTVRAHLEWQMEKPR